MHRLRPHHRPIIQRRYLSGGGFQGPTSRGMGRDGGGRGTGGKHREPRGGGSASAGRGSGGRGGRGDGGGDGGAFSAFRSKRNAALEKDLEMARMKTAQEGTGGRGRGVGGFGTRGQKPGVRVHKQTNHPPRVSPIGQDGKEEDHQGGGHRPGRVSHRGGPPKSNFAENVLRPASEGHATSKFTSGIPSLTARKHKGHQIHDEEQVVSGNVGQRRSGRASVRGEMSNRVIHDIEEEERGAAAASLGDSSGGDSTGLASMMSNRSSSERRVPKMAPTREREPAKRQRSLQYLRGNLDGGDGKGSDPRDVDDDEGIEYDDDPEDDPQSLADIIQYEHAVHSLETHVHSIVDNQDDDGYDSDADLMPVITPDNPDFFDPDKHEHVSKNEKGEYHYDWEAMDWDALMKLKEEGYYDAVGNEQGGRVFKPPPVDDDKDPIEDTLEYDYYFRDVCDVDNPLLLKPTEGDSKAVLPLKPHGPELDDFLLAVTDHPSKYAKMERKVKHPDSKREPRPTFPKHRNLPNEDFVKKYKGYLFVTGLVPHLDEETGDVKDFEDVSHQQTISEDVAKLFGIASMDVSPASPTSAYIGFATKLDAKQAMIDSATDGRLMAKFSISLQKYTKREEEEMTEEEKAFVAASPAGAESILKVTGLPASTTSVELLQSMIPPGSRLDAMFGPLSKEDYFRVSSTTALINLASADLVSKALKSTNIASNASKGVGQRSIQVLRAKRERVFDGWMGVNRAFGKSKLGTRLFVTGDVPPNDMYLSHNDMLHISGLPPNITLNDLSTFFQPFSADRRDVYGSGHIVRCSQGIPTGSAYVGFELPGEIDEVTELYKGKATMNGCDVTLRAVRDKLLRRGVRETARPSRSIKELHSDLYDWERHVDPKDIAELEELGVEKGVLDEIMITLRHHNRTFAAGDQSISGERLYQERAVGDHYASVVRKYLKLLKSCIGTREDPGLMYEAMFSPEQEVDMGLFDLEEERLKKLREKETV